MTASVDAIGLAAIIVPVLFALLGIAWRLGAIENKVSNVKEDVSDVKHDVRELRQIAGFPARKER